MRACIQIDDFPHGLLTFNSQDYISNLILSSMYEPLFFEENSEYRSLYVEDSYDGIYITLNFKDFFWSNGMLVTAKDMYNSLIYILENRTIFSSYLDFIEGVSEYLYGEGSINSIGITLYDKSLKIKTKYENNYKELFSTIHFSPFFIENGEVVNNISNGRFYLDKKSSDSISLKTNTFLMDKFFKKKAKIQELSFVYIKDLYKGIDEFKKGNLDMTCSTYFPFEEISNYNESPYFYMKNSNILFTLKIDKDLTPLKKDLMKILYDNCFNNQLLNKGINFCKNYFFDKELTQQDFNNNEINTSKNSINNNIRVLYPSYYPNDIVIKPIISYLKKKGIEIEEIALPLKEFNEVYNSSKFDIALVLLSPLVNNDIDLLIHYLKGFYNEEKIDTYLVLLNKYLESQAEYDKKKLNEYLIGHSQFIPIGFGKHLYFKSEKLKDLYIDRNDLYKYINIE